jgi:stage V sporulation protein B
MMNTHIARGAVFLTISSIIFIISGYIINIWLGRYLGPAEYGIYGIIISLVSIINITQTSGIPLAVSKYVASNNEKAEAVYKTGFFLQLISTCFIALLFFLLSTPIAVILKDKDLIPYIQLAALIFPFYGIFALITGFYNGLHDFKKQAVLHIVYSFIKIITIIPFAIFFHLSGVILGFILSPILTLLTGFHLPKATSGFSYKKLIIFSLPLIGIAIFSNLMQSVDLFFIKMLGASENDPGYYTASQNISRIPFFALSALSTVLLPAISRTVSENLENETKKYINNCMRIVLLLCIPIVLFMSATSADLLKFIYSSEYLPAAQSLSILLIGIAFLTIFTVQSNILNGAGNPKIPLVIAIVSVCITAVLCLFLIPLGNLTGAAFATTIGCFIAMILTTIMVYKKFKTVPSLRSFIKIVLVSLPLYFFAKVITFPLFFLPLFYFLLFSLYILSLIIIKELTKSDLELIRSLVPDFIRRKKKL